MAGSFSFGVGSRGICGGKVFSTPSWHPGCSIAGMRRTMSRIFNVIYPNACFALFVLLIGSMVYKTFKMAGAI